MAREEATATIPDGATAAPSSPTPIHASLVNRNREEKAGPPVAAALCRAVKTRKRERRAQTRDSRIAPALSSATAPAASSR